MTSTSQVKDVEHVFELIKANSSVIFKCEDDRQFEHT